jgi:hypothetical protein
LPLADAHGTGRRNVLPPSSFYPGLLTGASFTVAERFHRCMEAPAHQQSAKITADA